MAKKFVTEEGLSQVVDAVVDAIKKVSDKQITEEKVDGKIRALDLPRVEENMATLERRIDDRVTNEALGGKIEEAIGVANVEPIKEKIKTLGGRVPKANEANEGSGDTHTGETSSNTEERPIMVAPAEPI